jgi:hypothetical protein
MPMLIFSLEQKDSGEKTISPVCSESMAMSNMWAMCVLLLDIKKYCGREGNKGYRAISDISAAWQWLAG